MSCRGRTVVRSVAAAAGLLVAAGCGTEAVHVGDALVRLDVSRCYGTRCVAASAAPVLLDQEVEPAVCTIEKASSLEPLWMANARFPNVLAEVAPDDTLWVVSFRSDAVALQRFSPAGELLTDALIDASAEVEPSSVQASFAMSPDGDAFIGLTRVVTDGARGLHRAIENVLLRVDDGGELLAEPLPVLGLRGPLRIGTGADGSLLVAGNNAQGATVLASVDARGLARWVQTRLPQAELHTLLADRGGRALVSGNAADTVPFSFVESVALLDAGGDVLRELRPGTAWSSTSRKIARYPDGSWLVIGETLGAAQSPWSLARGLPLAFKLDSEARVMWSRYLNLPVFPLKAPAIDRDGSTYFAYDAWAVYRLDRDGACYAHPIALQHAVPAVDVSALHLGRDGIRYFTSMGGTRVGAFAP